MIRKQKSMSSAHTITIRLKRGTIGCNPTQRATVNGLGLKRREQVRTLENTPAVRGMIKRVIHLLEIIEDTLASPKGNAPRHA